MDIGKFIDEYSKLKDESAKERLMSKHITATYLPYTKKIGEAQKILDMSCYDLNDQSFSINTPVRYMLFVMSVVRNYTDLEFSTENGPEQFDLIEKYGVIETIIRLIQDDYEKFDVVLKMMLDDLMINERSTPSFIEKKFKSITEALDDIDTTEE